MNLGRMLIALGLLVAALGVLISLGEKLPIRFGRLPGDIIIRGKHSVFYFPLVTCLLISVVLSVVLWLINKR
jgi:ribose/xylose/arabinose/galactoside ABC-type transport system permease subunit